MIEKLAENVFGKNIEILKETGLHKIAGVMYGVPELTIRDAISLLGARAFVKRANANRIQHGILSAKALHGDKTASAALDLIELGKAALPVGVGAAATDYIMNPEKRQNDALERALRVGGIGALVGTGIHGLNQVL